MSPPTKQLKAKTNRTSFYAEVVIDAQVDNISHVTLLVHIIIHIKLG